MEQKFWLIPSLEMINHGIIEFLRHFVDYATLGL